MTACWILTSTTEKAWNPSGVMYLTNLWNDALKSALRTRAQIYESGPLGLLSAGVHRAYVDKWVHKRFLRANPGRRIVNLVKRFMLLFWSPALPQHLEDRKRTSTRAIVAASSHGNIRLQRGQYYTQKDVDAKYERIAGLKTSSRRTISPSSSPK